VSYASQDVAVRVATSGSGDRACAPRRQPERAARRFIGDRGGWGHLT
jgi:hypothetical protein